MIRLHAIVEGRTEERFIKEVLTSHLANYQIYTNVCRVETSRSKHRDDVIHKGGMTTYKHLKHDIKLRIASDNHPECRYTMMIDFYQIPDDFPCYEKMNSNITKYDQVKMLEDALTKDIGDSRFIPYIQLHEFESLLFVNPEQLNCLYFDRENEIQKLVEMSRIQPNPELINNGLSTAPSKRIISLIPEYQDNKPDGAWIASKIGLNELKAKCLHFRKWVETLENLK